MGIVKGDATYWAQKIKKREISPAELLQLVNQRVVTLNPKYNAIVELDLAKGLAELKKRQFKSEMPFAGVPIALKMLGQMKKGMGDTSGSSLFKEHRSQTTDYFVRGLENVGFVPFGKTNVPEFGFKNISDAQLYGVTKNVWQPAYHAGGSSGGAASALASGMFPIVAASDGGGSIRIPASFSGLIGLKPTRGSIPTGPTGWRGWQGASVNFALTISMRDTRTLFQTLQGSHKAAPYHAPFYQSKAPIKARERPLKIAYCLASPINNQVSLGAELALKKALNFLEKQGHHVVPIEYPVSGEALITSYYQMNAAETAAMMAGIEGALKRSITRADVEPMTWALYQYGKQISAAEYIKVLGEWDQAAFVMETLFEEYDVFLSPTATDVAPLLTTDLQSLAIRQQLQQAEDLSKNQLSQLIYQMFEKSLEITPYTQLANLTGQPGISLPVYVAPNQLPIGIQLMASKGEEEVLFQIGEAFEEAQQFILPKSYQSKIKA